MSISPERTSRRCTTTSLACPAPSAACPAPGWLRPAARWTQGPGWPGSRAGCWPRRRPRRRLPLRAVPPAATVTDLAGRRRPRVRHRRPCPRARRALRPSLGDRYLTWLSCPEQARCRAPVAEHRNRLSRHGDCYRQAVAQAGVSPPAPRLAGRNYHAPDSAATAARMAPSRAVIKSLLASGENTFPVARHASRAGVRHAWRPTALGSRPAWRAAAPGRDHRRGGQVELAGRDVREMLVDLIGGGIALGDQAGPDLAHRRRFQVAARR